MIIEWVFPEIKIINAFKYLFFFPSTQKQKRHTINENASDPQQQCVSLASLSSLGKGQHWSAHWSHCQPCWTAASKSEAFQPREVQLSQVDEGSAVSAAPVRKHIGQYLFLDTSQDNGKTDYFILVLAPSSYYQFTKAVPLIKHWYNQSFLQELFCVFWLPSN